MNQKEKSQLYRDIGKTVRVRRGNMELKQEVLAARVGISRATLANIETGRQGVLVHQLYELAKQLDLDPGDLLPSVAAKRSTEKSEALPLPGNLNDQQIAQLSQLLNGAPTQGEQTKGEPSVKKTKRAGS